MSETAFSAHISLPVLDKTLIHLLCLGLMAKIFQADFHLIQRVLRNDVTGWQKLITIYGPSIWKAVARYSKDYDERMSAFMLILEKLKENDFARLRSFRCQSSLSTWLIAVSRHLALDFLRAKYGRDFHSKRMNTVSLDSQPELQQALATTSNPEKIFIAQEETREKLRLSGHLQQALRELGDREKLLLKAVYIERLSMQEAGQLFNIRAVYKFHQRLLKKMRRQMALSMRQESHASIPAREGKSP